MSSHPATFYHYEPLLHFDIKQARHGHLAQVRVRTSTLSQLTAVGFAQKFSHRIWVEIFAQKSWRKFTNFFIHFRENKKKFVWFLMVKKLHSHTISPKKFQKVIKISQWWSKMSLLLKKILFHMFSFCRENLKMFNFRANPNRQLLTIRKLGALHSFAINF